MSLIQGANASGRNSELNGSTGANPDGSGFGSGQSLIVAWPALSVRFRLSRASAIIFSTAASVALSLIGHSPWRRRLSQALLEVHPKLSDIGRAIAAGSRLHF